VSEMTEVVWERRLADGLHTLAESEAPATTVALAEVIASARILVRQRRRNHRIFALSAVLIVVLALTVGIAVADGQGGACALRAGFPASPAFAVSAAGDAAASITLGGRIGFVVYCRTLTTADPTAVDETADVIGCRVPGLLAIV
jgi:hypothetical protein